MKFVVLAALSLSFLSQPVFAKALSDAQIQSTISGKTVRLATRWGSFPLIYRANKSVTGNGEALGLARFFAPKETGKWWVAGGRLCQQFPTWYDGKPNCFSLTATGGNNLTWVREDGYSGTATVSN